jgi:hypothetical protein
VAAAYVCDWGASTGGGLLMVGADGSMTVELDLTDLGSVLSARSLEARRLLVAGKSIIYECLGWVGISIEDARRMMTTRSINMFRLL